MRNSDQGGNLVGIRDFVLLCDVRMGSLVLGFDTGLFGDCADSVLLLYLLRPARLPPVNDQTQRDQQNHRDTNSQ